MLVAAFKFFGFSLGEKAILFGEITARGFASGVIALFFSAIAFVEAKQALGPGNRSIEAVQLLLCLLALYVFAGALENFGFQITDMPLFGPKETISVGKAWLYLLAGFVLLRMAFILGKQSS